jgi:hypothetical protein
VTSTTTTTAPGSLHLTGAKLRAESAAGAANGSIRLRGNFATPPTISFPPPFSVRVQDGAALDRTHLFTNCTMSFGRVRCSDAAADGRFKASFKPSSSNPALTNFRVSFLRQAISGPFAPPVTVTLTHNGGVVRTGTIASCRSSGSRLSCRQL